MLRLLLVPLLALTPAEEPAGRETRTYDIRFLTAPIHQLPARIWPNAGNLILGGGDGLPGLDSGGSPIAFSAGFAEDEESVAPPGVGVSPEEIATLIRRNIAEDSWANSLTRITAEKGKLLVHNVPQVHEAIASLLGVLRAQRAKLIRVDVAYVPAEALPDREGAANPFLAEGAFEAALERAGERGRRISLTAYNEQRVSGFTGKTTTRLVDNEVNSTGVIPVVNPVIESLPMGLSLEVHPLAIAGTDWIRLELQVCRLWEAGETERRRTFFGDLEFLPLAEESLQTVLLMPVGRPCVAGTFRDSLVTLAGKKETREYAVIAKAHSVDLKVKAPKGLRSQETFQVRAYDVSFLLEPLADNMPLLNAEIIEGLLRHNVDPEAWRDERASIEHGNHNRLLRVTARPPTHSKVKAFLGKLVRESARMAHIEVMEIEGPLDELRHIQAAAEGRILLPRDWSPGNAKALQVVFRAEMAGMLGSRIIARSYEARGFVMDLELLSGGTGFAVYSVPDAVIGSSGTGFELEASLHPVHSGGCLALRVDLDRCQTTFERAARVNVAADIGPLHTLPGALGWDSKKDKEGENAAAPTPSRLILPFDVDLPAQRSAGCHKALALPVARPAILALESVRAGRGRMVVAKVSDLGLSEEGR